ncbi:DUF4293 family protein [Fodinibius sediminis]|uniref:Transcription termination factor Rho n=1 Tax=Fodinibius sediminis TaxID=1214077 RepID=A0A521CLS3_9BACT|nr:DUF4293 family protein [Fodinibius sediminis]SMO59701.1 transcription termination factor Rho [Fodinibius sediminis]
MIQRIQSIILFLSFLLNGSVFFNALYEHAVTDPGSWIGITFAVTLTLAALLPLVSIFLYNNRQFQLRVVTISLWTEILALGFGTGIYSSLGGFGSFLWDESIGLGLLIAALLLTLFARKKIKDDIELVKSMDRIR